jgi:hypothetical protein
MNDTLISGGIVVVLILIISFLSGWRDLASYYAATRKPVGRSFWFRSASIGRVGYGACLKFTADAEGLGIRSLPRMGLFDRPLLLPWADLSARVDHGLFARASVRVSAVPDVKISLSTALFLELTRAAGVSVENLESRWEYERPPNNKMQRTSHG